MRNSENVDIFGKRLLEFIRPFHNSTFYICNPYCITLLTRLCIGLNHLNEHKFKHGFNDTVNVICVCECAVESINLFLCSEFSQAGQTLFGKIQRMEKILIDSLTS